MLLTGRQISEEKAALNLMLAKMKNTAHSAEAPVFTVKGPVTLPVRRRTQAMSRPMVGGGKVVQSSTPATFAFTGGEKLRLSDVFVTSKDDIMSSLLHMTLTPTEVTLAANVASVTLAFDVAFEHLEGSQAWTEAMVQAVQVSLQPMTKEEKLQQQLEQDEVYGSW